MDIQEVKGNVSTFFKQHILIEIALVFCLFLLIVGNSISGSEKKKYDAAFNQLNEVNNRISQDSITVTQQTNYVAKGLIGGLDKKRWADDDVIITEWIYPAFTFESAEEYNQHREIYVSRLGVADDFVMEVLPPYIAGYSEARSESGTIDDGTSINMKITGFQSYVDGFKDDVYSYVAVVSCSSTLANGQTNTSDIILTYSINGKGEVMNFHAATPFTEN